MSSESTLPTTIDCEIFKKPKDDCGNICGLLNSYNVSTNCGVRDNNLKTYFFNNILKIITGSGQERRKTFTYLRS